MIKQALIAATAVLAMTAAATAYAGSCSDDQESTAGMLAASVAKTAVSKVMAVTGKQMVNIENCDFHGGAYNVDFKYNFLAADGLYWVEASDKFNDLKALFNSVGTTGLPPVIHLPSFLPMKPRPDFVGTVLLLRPLRKASFPRCRRSKTRSCRCGLLCSSGRLDSNMSCKHLNINDWGNIGKYYSPDYSLTD